VNREGKRSGVDMQSRDYINQYGLSRKVRLVCYPNLLYKAMKSADDERTLTRQHIFDSVRASLKRLDMEYIDVLQCHRSAALRRVWHMLTSSFDYNTPIEETVRPITSVTVQCSFSQMQALHDVVQKGWVRYIGMSR
jgi:aryl-alcohol dehydrogenase-like predicted oxidoreductase